MKTNQFPSTFASYSRRAAVAGFCVALLLLTGGRAGANGFTASGPTYLNVYVTDGFTTVAPSVSPYNPSETIFNNTGIGTPLTSYAAGSWLQNGQSTYPYPGYVSANWGPDFFFNANVTAIVNYQQSTYFYGSNNVSSSSVTPTGTSLTFVNSGSGIGELRLDWATQYTYNGPPVWTPNTSYNFGDTVSDGNGNFQYCVVAGTSGSSAPTWVTTGSGGLITFDNNVQWALGLTYVPNFFIISFSGAVHNYSAVVAQQSFQLGANPPGNEVLIWGGDFLNYGDLPAGLSADLDSWFSANGSVFGYDTPGATYNTSPYGDALPYQRCYNGNTMNAWGYIDVFIDPGSGVVSVQPSLPPELGIIMRGSDPVVYIQTVTGNNMTLQMCTNLATTNWTSLTNLAPTTVTVNSAQYLGFEITNPPPMAAFFRVKP